MKTELIRNFSTASLAAIARSDSSLSVDGISDSYSPSFEQDNNFNEAPKGVGLGGCCSDFFRNICRRKTLEKKFPLIKWIPQYNTEKLIADIIAGFTVGLTILPQGLAYATVAGLPPQYGLYSGFVGCFIYILLGGTDEVTIGPTAIMAIITYTYTRGKPAAYAVALCLITGVVTLLMGLLQLGFIVNFISTPVNSGFTSAAAITIISTQVKGLLGLSFAAEGFLPVIKGTIANIMKVKLWDSILSLICILVLLFMMKLQLIFGCIAKHSVILNKFLWFISTARNAIIVIVCTGIASAIGSSQPFTIVGHIVPGIPDFESPPFEIYDPNTNVTSSYSEILKEEASAIIVVPLLAIMEHITIAKAFAGSKQIDASQEMISIGISNIIGCFFSSMPVCGSFSRTTVNAMSGARSPMGGLVTGSIVLLALRFLTPYFYYIPKASLAAVIVCAVAFTIEIGIIKPMWRSKKMDFIPWGCTFIVSLFVGLEFGMMTGFIISVIYLLYYAARPGVKVRRGYTGRGTEFILVELDRSCAFPSVEYIRYVIMKSGSSWGKNTIPMVVDCLHIQFVDFTAAQGIKDLIQQFNKRDQLIVLWKAKPSLVRILSGVMEDFVTCKDDDALEKLIDNTGRKITMIDSAHTPMPQQREKYSNIPLS